MAEKVVQELADLMTEPDQVETDTEAVGELEVTEKTDKPDKPKEKVFTEKEVEAEKAKVQSAFEKKYAAEKKAKDDVLARLAQLEHEREADKVLLEHEKAEKERQFLDQLGDLPEGAKLQAIYNQLADREKKLSEREAQANQKYNAGEFGLKLGHAHRLGKEYEVDWESLMDTKTESEMETKALKLKAEKLEKELEAAKAAPKESTQKPEETETDGEAPVHLDSGVRVTGQPKRVFTEKEIQRVLADDTGKLWQKYGDAISKQLGLGT